MTATHQDVQQQQHEPATLINQMSGTESATEVLQLASLRLEELHALSQAGALISPRALNHLNHWWLGEAQDEAAELAALLHEAAPRLALSGLSTPTAGLRASALPKARSFELLPDVSRRRLARAAPMPSGPGQIDWGRLVATIASETLHPTAPPPGQSAVGGQALDVNSGGRVLFCLFDRGTPAPTPPTSLAPSPEKEPRPASAAAAAEAAAGAGAGAGAGAPSWAFADSPTKGLLTEAGAPSPQVLSPARVSSAAAALAAAAAGLLPLPQGSGGSGGSVDLAAAAAAVAAAAGGDAATGGIPLPLPGLGWPPLVGDVEGCVVLKFVQTRLLCQSEQFAAELTRHVGLCAPESRILRSSGSSGNGGGGGDSGNGNGGNGRCDGSGDDCSSTSGSSDVSARASVSEWDEAVAAAAALKAAGYPDLAEEMSRSK